MITNTKTNAANTSVIRVIALITMKVIIGVLTGSLSILAEALNSITDLIAAIIAAIAVRFSDKPADAEHKNGHGFIEAYSGIIEASMMFIAAAFIVVEAINKIMNPTEVASAYLIAIGIAVMIVSIVVDIKVSSDLMKAAEETNSIALMASAQNVRADVFSSAIVLVGLISTIITGIAAIDAVIAVLASGVVARVGMTTLGRSIKALKNY